MLESLFPLENILARVLKLRCLRSQVGSLLAARRRAALSKQALTPKGRNAI
jgi:hypothetical protein